MAVWKAANPNRAEERVVNKRAEYCSCSLGLEGGGSKGGKVECVEGTLLSLQGRGVELKVQGRLRSLKGRYREGSKGYKEGCRAEGTGKALKLYQEGGEEFGRVKVLLMGEQDRNCRTEGSGWVLDRTLTGSLWPLPDSS
eukprot:88065-Chlamydomonas_euryale.AAC.1